MCIRDSDYTTILTKLKGANPEVVLFTGYFPEAGLLLRQKKDMNWKVPFIGGDATNNADLVKIAGKEAAEGYYFLSPPQPQDLDTADAKNFLTDYQKKYNELPPSIWAVLGAILERAAYRPLRQSPRLSAVVSALSLIHI